MAAPMLLVEGCTAAWTVLLSPSWLELLDPHTARHFVCRSYCTEQPLCMCVRVSNAACQHVPDASWQKGLVACWRAMQWLGCWGPRAPSAGAGKQYAGVPASTSRLRAIALEGSRSAKAMMVAEFQILGSQASWHLTCLLTSS